MYILRTVKDGREVTLPPCLHFAKKPLDRTHSLGLSPHGGVEVEITFPRSAIDSDIPYPVTVTKNVARIVITLPDDADKVYVMNKDGHTVDMIQYPPAEANRVR